MRHQAQVLANVVFRGRDQVLTLIDGESLVPLRGVGWVEADLSDQVVEGVILRLILQCRIKIVNRCTVQHLQAILLGVVNRPEFSLGIRHARLSKRGVEVKEFKPEIVGRQVPIEFKHCDTRVRLAVSGAAWCNE